MAYLAKLVLASGLLSAAGRRQNTEAELEQYEAAEAGALQVELLQRRLLLNAGKVRAAGGPDASVEAKTPEEVEEHRIPKEAKDELELVRSNKFNETELYKGVVFFGHMNPDADSLGCAYGAAEFFGGGSIPACPMPREKCPNAETAFIMEHFGVSVDEIPVLNEIPDIKSKKFVVVDFNEPAKGPEPFFPKGSLPTLTEAVPGQDVDMWQTPPVLGTIDHHALQMEGVKVMESPGLFYGKVGPDGFIAEAHAWGSVSTVLAFKFKFAGREPSKKAAGMLAGAILSDTLGLTGPTTTEFDRQAISFLSPFAGIADYSKLYEDMAIAKSASVLTDPLVQTFDADLKTYIAVPDKVKLVIGSVEVANDEIYQGMLTMPPAELQEGIKGIIDKYNSTAPSTPEIFVYIFLVDTKEKKSSVLMLTEGPEKCIALQALSKANASNTLPAGKECRSEAAEAHTLGDNEVYAVPTPDCTSRKSQVQPSLEAAIKQYTAGELTC